MFIWSGLLMGSLMFMRLVLSIIKSSLMLLCCGHQKLFMDNSNQNCKMLSWNIRGMNSTVRQENLKQLVTTFRPDLICIQESRGLVPGVPPHIDSGGPRRDPL
jgi:hypothetical protein